MASARSSESVTEIVFVVGPCGSGRSSILDALADFGFFSVANLPVPLIQPMIDHAIQNKDRRSSTGQHSALVLDIDSPTMARSFASLVDSFNASPPHSSKQKKQPRKSNPNLRVHVIYSDSSNETLIRRYRETRRPHPRFDAKRDRSLVDTLEWERAMLLPLRERATLRVDTSDLTIHDLRRTVLEFTRSLSRHPRATARINFVSFGFKSGIPRDCDLVVDVRFLPNPHFVPRLRPTTGLDPRTARFVLQLPDTKKFLSHYQKLLAFLLPRYIFEGKSYINIGIGCTGGQHRSVVIATELARRIGKVASLRKTALVSVQHRDIPNKSP